MQTNKLRAAISKPCLQKNCKAQLISSQQPERSVYRHVLTTSGKLNCSITTVYYWSRADQSETQPHYQVY